MSETPILLVRRVVTLDSGRADLQAQREVRERPMIFYGSLTCWWTHDPRQLYRGPHDLPTDSRGGVLFQTDDPDGFLREAEANAGHYGRHGIDAFVAAHNANSYVLGGRPWCERMWDAYNDALDRWVER